MQNFTKMGFLLCQEFFRIMFIFMVILSKRKIMGPISSGHLAQMIHQIVNAQLSDFLNIYIHSFNMCILAIYYMKDRIKRGIHSPSCGEICPTFNGMQGVVCRKMYKFLEFLALTQDYYLRETYLSPLPNNPPFKKKRTLGDVLIACRAHNFFFFLVLKRTQLRCTISYFQEVCYLLSSQTY